MHVGRVDLLARLPGYDFVVTEQVVAEVERPVQKQQLQRALESGVMRIEPTSDPPVITLYAELRHQMGAGEAASLALAFHRGWVVASDEKKAFRREATTRLGPSRILTTPGIYVLAIRSGLLSVEAADADKESLALQRFTLSFSSFKDVL